MNITAIRFTAAEAAAYSCTGCLLENEMAGECPKAWSLAQERGLPMCGVKTPSGKQYIYVVDTIKEPRNG